MKLDACTLSVVHWLIVAGPLSLEELVCERLFLEFTERDIIHSLGWLSSHHLIESCHDPVCLAPYQLMPGYVDYSDEHWRLSELGTIVRWHAAH
ncbi:MAG: hypothetical protein ACRCRW_07220 [Aeromonadaceae bacterium]